MTRPWAERLLAVFFPNRCAYCGEVVAYPDRLCAACEADLPLISPPACPDCGRARTDCVCQHHRHPYDLVLSPFYYRGVVRRALLRLKAAERPATVRELAARMLRRFVQSGHPLPDGVTYVPMTRRDERDRGYNQSRLLAAEIADGLQLPLIDGLRKVQQTRPQKGLTALERSGNVLGAFDAAPGTDLSGKTLLLIDDLVTTGATAGECAKVLKLYGAEKVILLAAAVDPPRKQK
ncbi:MAG: ComF family protein [Acutalibacteraceae bacterium]|jgi:competence protein ComFC